MKKIIKRFLCDHKGLYTRDTLGCITCEHTFFKIHRCNKCGALFIEVFGETVDKDFYKRIY